MAIPPKPRILLTEDHEDTREMVRLILQQSDYEVATASNIVETLLLAKSGNFNLFIFDLCLPDGSGIDLCRKVRAFNQRTPILFYSGWGLEKDKNLALSAGAQAYLLKPIEAPQLLQTIRDLLAREKSGLLHAHSTVGCFYNGSVS